MSLSCYCDDYDSGDWWHYGPDDFTRLGTKRPRKCCSCKKKIMPGDECAEFPRARYPAYDSIEEKIVGEGNEVWLSSYWMCEECAGLYMALNELGFCITLPSSMRKLAREYSEMQKEAAARRTK